MWLILTNESIEVTNDFVVFTKLISSHTNDRREEKNDLELFLG